jgi:hypothetical protein
VNPFNALPEIIVTLTPIINVIAPESFFTGRVGDVAPKLSAEDRLEMIELTSRFEWCFDTRHLDELEASLTDDVVIDHLFGLATNRTESMKMLREVVPFRNIRHQATNAVPFIDEKGRPAVLSFLMVVQVHDDDGKVKDLLPRVLAHALITDVMRKENGKWRIAGRTFEQMCTSRDYLPSDEAWLELQQTASERAAKRSSRAQAAE